MSVEKIRRNKNEKVKMIVFGRSPGVCIGCGCLEPAKIKNGSKTIESHRLCFGVRRQQTNKKRRKCLTSERALNTFRTTAVRSRRKWKCECVCLCGCI